MITVRAIVREFIFLVVLMAVCAGGTWMLVQYVYETYALPDIRVGQELITFGIWTIALVLFVVLGALIFGLRFLFLRSRNLTCGLVAIGFMVALHLLVHTYAPVYIQLRKLTSSPALINAPLVYTDQGWPTTGSMDESFEQTMAQWNEWDEDIRQEVKWVQLVLGAISFILVVTFIFSLFKRRQHPPA